MAAGLAGMAGSRREGELTEGMRLFGAVDRMLQAEQRLLAPADEQVRRDELAAIAPASGLPGL